MDFDEIRRRVIIALCSDDELMETLILKGGNGLLLIHKIGSRASIDLDYSMAGEFGDLDAAGARLLRVLQDTFAPQGIRRKCPSPY